MFCRKLRHSEEDRGATYAGAHAARLCETKAASSSSPKIEACWLDDPEVRLMLRVQEGDNEAFRQLVDRYNSRIFGFFRRRLGDRQEAEDLTQEVMLRLFRSRSVTSRARVFLRGYFTSCRMSRATPLRFRRRHPCVRLPRHDE